VPDAQLPEIRDRIPTAKVRLIPESELIPELAFYRKALRAHPRRSRRRLRGTAIHQIIKIGIARRVETPFYLTLDADVICLKPVRYDDLVRDGRGINRRNRENLHPEWYRGSERLLGLRRSGFEHGVTPAILSREAIIRLQDFLESRIGRPFRMLRGLARRGSKFYNIVGSWRAYLLRNASWTEYSLYMTFLEASGLYETYHFDAGPTAVYSACVWYRNGFDSWNPGSVLSAPDSYFSLVQSTTGIDPRLVAEKVDKILEAVPS
jgi:hypothetical protein